MTSRRFDAVAAGALTMLVVLLYVLDTRAWVSQSQSWLHTDGLMHLARIQNYAEGLGDQFGPNLDVILGYGPLAYLVSGAVMVIEGGTAWPAAVDGQLLFASVGLCGTGLVAARFGGPWAAPVAAALLAGLPAWRSHTVEVMVDQPSASLAALSLGLLLWSDGLRRPALALGAGVATGLALTARWPVAFFLGPMWAASVMLSAWRSGRGLRDAAVVLLVGLLAGGLLAGPPLLLVEKVPLDQAVAVAAAVALLALGAGLLGAWRRDWAGGAIGATLAMAAVVLPLTLWAPSAVRDATAVITEMQATDSAVAVLAPLQYRLERALHVLAVWQWGPILTVCAPVGTLLLMRRREQAPGPRSELLLLLLPIAATLIGVLHVMQEPDERHVMALLPVVVAIAATVPFVLPGPPRLRQGLGSTLAGLLVLFGLLGVFAWRAELPGVVAAEHWRRDINLMREPWESPLRASWFVGGALWASVGPFDGGPDGQLAGLILGSVPADSGACIAMLVSPRVPDIVHVPNLVQRLEGQTQHDRRRIDLSDARDRPGSLLADYDGFIVLAPSHGFLPARVMAARPDLVDLGTVALPLADSDNTVPSTVLLSTARLSADGCDRRFPGLELLPLGEGWQRGVPLPADLPD